MCILGTDDSQREDGLVMAVFGEGALLYWCVFGSNVPLNYISGLSCADDDVWLIWVENGFGHLVLANESNFRSCLQIRGENVDEPIWLIISVF